MKKVLIMASGNGSNFETIVKYFKNRSDISFELLCDNPFANALIRAEKLGVKACVVNFSQTFEFLENKKFDLYVLAGYMRILPQKILDFGTFINIHPSLLPNFKGMGAIEKTYRAKTACGVTIHYVDADVDSGKIIKQIPFKMPPDMTLDEFEKEIHKIEHAYYPKVIEEILF